MDTAIIDLASSVGILCFTSAVATNAITLPTGLITTVVCAVVLVAGLLLSMVLPLVGISLLILAIIMFFRRNMNQTIQGTLQRFEAERAYPPTPSIYGESTIPLDTQGFQTPGYDSTQSSPRDYTQNIGTLDVQQGDRSVVGRGVDSSSVGSQGVGSQGVGSQGVEGFTPATLEQSAELDPPKGQYRTDESRQTAFPVTDEYTYRPAADTGSNDFHRFGPQMDKKVDSFRYYA